VEALICPVTVISLTTLTSYFPE